VLIGMRAGCPMNGVFFQIELVIFRLNGIRVDRHVFASLGFEPDDLGVA
jgi:hypothetical protein